MRSCAYCAVFKFTEFEQYFVANKSSSLFHYGLMCTEHQYQQVQLHCVNPFQVKVTIEEVFLLDFLILVSKIFMHPESIQDADCNNSHYLHKTAKTL